MASRASNFCYDAADPEGNEFCVLTPFVRKADV